MLKEDLFSICNKISCSWYTIVDYFKLLESTKSDEIMETFTGERKGIKVVFSQLRYSARTLKITEELKGQCSSALLSIMVHDNQMVHNVDDRTYTL